MLEFAGCMVRPDETRYQVECPPGVGEISVLLRSLNEDAPFSLTVRLPVNPVALTVTDGNGEPVRRAGEAVQRSRFPKRPYMSIHLRKSNRESERNPT